MLTHKDTIVALSSGALPSGVAVIRLSGPASAALVGALCGPVPEPRRLSRRQIRQPDTEMVLDEALVAYFPAPSSFTGEDCAELQVHGSPAGVRAILRLLQTQQNVRLAEAGEFTRRAFENGKLDLTQVVGLSDLLAAETEGQLALAMARFGGAFAQKLGAWRQQLILLSMEIEARLDFSDEGDVGDLPQSWVQDLRGLRTELIEELALFDQGRIVREGYRIALAGSPNAGKSSLLNALARSDVAIVTAEAGTTRDVREVALNLGGQLVVLVDMAGLRQTESAAEAEGVRRALSEVARADLVLWLMAPDIADREPVVAAEGVPLWRVGTKADLGPVEEAVDLEVSAVRGDGLAELIGRLRDAAAAQTRGAAPLLISHERDLSGLKAAAACLSEAQDMVLRPELAAESLRSARESLGRLLGLIDTEMVLDSLFSQFCIGK